VGKRVATWDKINREGVTKKKAYPTESAGTYCRRPTNGKKRFILKEPQKTRNTAEGNGGWATFVISFRLCVPFIAIRKGAKTGRKPVQYGEKGHDEKRISSF